MPFSLVFIVSYRPKPHAKVREWVIKVIQSGKQMPLLRKRMDSGTGKVENGSSAQRLIPIHKLNNNLPMGPQYETFWPSYPYLVGCHQVHQTSSV